MKNIVVVNNINEWKIGSAEFELVSAKDYLYDEKFQKSSRFRVYNLCRKYTYCSFGYYVSLLAQARGHRPIPSVSSLLDLKNQGIIKHNHEEMDQLIQKSLSSIKSNEFELSVYFGRNLSAKYDRLSYNIYSHFRVPFVRAFFENEDGKEWKLKNVRPIPFNEIPLNHHEFVMTAMTNFFKKRNDQNIKSKNYKYDLAILVNPLEKMPPSNVGAIKKFIKAAEKENIRAEVLEPSEMVKLMTFDALLIRETTSVDHHTYRSARKAEAEGLVVIDDPQSILRCCNKVFLHELLKVNSISTPKTWVLSSNGLNQDVKKLNFPLVLKDPESAFSQGVKKVNSIEELNEKSELFFKNSDLLIVQEFMPTDFDWRVGIIDGKPLYVCKYFMARSHWQIINSDGSKGNQNGKSEAIPLNEVSPRLLEIAVQSTKLIGNGLYGVDIKEKNGKYYVIEVNDNPSIDEGYEDQILKGELYTQIIKSMKSRLDERTK